MTSGVRVTSGTKVGSDDPVAQLRERATRLLALALKAREAGDAELSETIVAAAVQCEEKANALEVAAAKPKEV